MRFRKAIATDWDRIAEDVDRRQGSQAQVGNEARIAELEAELERHHRQWFYLHCHPEDVDLVTAEMLGMRTNLRDIYGHVIREG